MTEPHAEHTVRYPEAYLEYLVLYHADRDYFNCHEVLEEFWQANKTGDLAAAWLGLIQIAVAQYHERRGNCAGALKMLASAIRNLRAEDVERLGINRSLLSELAHRHAAVAAKLAASGPSPAEANEFRDLDLPLQDTELLRLCREKCRLAGKAWLSPSDMANRDIVDKHVRRDRTEVVAERAAELAKRRALRGKPAP
ncbi:MAG TPA: DUF309 domain-containing protein [Bacilli bacterium]